MKSRPAAATFFVIFCLLLCGLILRRQITAHPLPPDRGQTSEDSQRYGGQQDFWGDFQDWHPAPLAATGLVHAAVQEELTALRDGNASKAIAGQSQFMQQRFSNPNEFLQIYLERHPEMGQFHHLQYGPVWMDKTGQNARTVILIVGRNGERARDDFLLAREDGRFKIAHLRTQMLPN